MSTRKYLFLICTVAGLSIPAFCFADNLISTSIEVEGRSSFALLTGDLNNFKIDRCVGKPVEGEDWKWSGTRCYVSTVRNNNVAFGSFNVYSEDPYGQCSFYLILDSKGGKPYEKVDMTVCGGEFSTVKVKKLSDYQYSLKVIKDH